MRIVLAAALLAIQAHAQAGDPLKSPECGHAVEQLQAARAATPQSPHVEALRRQAAAACFGTTAPPSRPGRVQQAPVQVPRTVYDVAVPKAVPALPAPPPPVAIERGPTISSCDAAGCWVSSGGNRLQHVMPSQMGPSGLCAIAPGAAGCP